MEIILMILVSGVAIYLINSSYSRNEDQAEQARHNVIDAYNQQLADLKDAYDLALKGTNRSDALLAGRAYFSFIRNGNLTIHDEQAILIDLSRMK
jgi:hypothetical protein